MMANDSWVMGESVINDRFANMMAMIINGRLARGCSCPVSPVSGRNCPSRTTSPAAGGGLRQGSVAFSLQK